MPQIIQQPEGDGKTYFAIFSQTVDDFTHLSLTADEVVRHFASLAYEKERERVLKLLEALQKGIKRPGQLSWGEANKRAYEARPDQYEFKAR